MQGVDGTHPEKVPGTKPGLRRCTHGPASRDVLREDSGKQQKEHRLSTGITSASGVDPGLDLLWTQSGPMSTANSFGEARPARKRKTTPSLSVSLVFPPTSALAGSPPLLAGMSLKMLEAAITSFPTEYTVHVITALTVGLVTFYVLRGLKTTKEGDVDASAVPLNGLKTGEKDAANAEHQEKEGGEDEWGGEWWEGYTDLELMARVPGSIFWPCENEKRSTTLGLDLSSEAQILDGSRTESKDQLRILAA
ncbi:hypothetical protein B0H11DRAFT_1900210 [Mycena galericulata]|nr:hypothetical protein B0H11DRAFT_1900210 [Mycena galericulata]